MLRINNLENNNIYLQNQNRQKAPSEPEKKPDIPPKGTKPATEDPLGVAIDSVVNIPAGSHRVQKGQTLYSIANHYGTTVAKIIELNPELKTDKNGNKVIQLGSIIKVFEVIDTPQQPVIPPQEDAVYGSWQIEKGKGAYSIMSKFNLFKEELEMLNPDIDLENIKKDQIFKVPGYEVKSGDNLTLIAKAHDITLSMLKELNPGLDDNTIKSGQILNVPKLAGQNLISEQSEPEVPPESGQPQPEVEQPTQKITHKVKNGEALSKIAEKYGVPTWAVMLHNKIEDVDKIYKNQVLEIPTEEEVAELTKLKDKSQAPPEKVQSSHTVKKGDTLSEIALKYGVTVAQIKEWNGLKNNDIRPGQVLQLSKPETGAPEQKPPAQNAPVQYTVKKGDVLSKIALKYGVSTASIMFKNDIQNPKHIQPGQKIIIPDKEEAAELERAQKRIQTERKTPSSAPQQTISSGRGIVIHKVRKNDTIKDIAKKYNIPVKDLLMYNDNLRGVNSSTKLSEKEIKHIQIIATKKAVIDATGVSEEFINDLISIEKKKSRIYNDACGIPTIGIGHNTRAHRDTEYYRGKTLSDNQIYSLLARDITDAQNKIKAAIGKDAYDNLSRGQKEALYGLIFNTGGLSGSPKLVQALKAGDYVEAACQMDQACGTVNGRMQVLPGLAKRRFMDIAKFVDGSRFSSRETKTVMETVQRLYDSGFNNIRNKNSRVDYNAYAKKFLGEFIDRQWIAIKE